MYPYLNDNTFLSALDKIHLRTTYARIFLLDFTTEKILREIQGEISSGNLNLSSSAATRRTINLTMFARRENIDIENIDNEISVKRKIRVEIGFKNPLKHYRNYGEIIWFPCGLFVLSSASIQQGINGWSINISGKDKMCLLDGTAGGTFPAPIVFHEKIIENADGTARVEHPTIFQIIFEAINHWGGEDSTHIIITDVPNKIKQLVKYAGSSPIYFNNDYSAFSYVYDSENFPNRKSYGDDTGYFMTDFTYPGELVTKAGDTVMTLLNKIVEVLGNYEFFYDLDGNFRFQEIKNYKNTNSSLLELSGNEETYLKSYDNKKYTYSLTDVDTVINIGRSPKFDNIKNDFIVWGQKTSTSGEKIDIHYHLAIDNKPLPDLAMQYMWAVYNTSDELIAYRFTSSNVAPVIVGSRVELLSKPCKSYEWREELYRRALVANVTNSVYDNYYDAELIAWWRQIYNPDKAYAISPDWPEWPTGWSPQVTENPRSLVFWLDFISSGAAIGTYSVKEIGRRTKVVNNNNIKSIYNKEIEDIVFLENRSGDPDFEELLEYYDSIGQWYCALQPNEMDMFIPSSTGPSCFDEIRDMLYQHLCYNTSISITCLPRYYFDVNNIIFINDKTTGILGNYQITQITLPLAYSGTMSIQAIEVWNRD